MYFRIPFNSPRGKRPELFLFFLFVESAYVVLSFQISINVSALSKTVFKGVVWSLLNTFGKFALKFFFALAITRILTPSDYSLVAYMRLFLEVAT